MEMDLFAIQKDLAAIRLVDPCDHFNEGGFSGAVFSQQRMDFPRPQRHRNMVQNFHTGKAFRDIF
jgi:hypothetical protein